MPDDRLRLIFTCRHPALGQQSQVELTLRLLCGMSTAEVASAFVTAEPTMAKRLVRTKHKIKAANILIGEGHALVRWCLRRNQPGPYQLQAAIAAVHADAASFAETDWAQILTLYDQLMVVAPTPVVALNRAVAVGEVRGPAAGLGEIDTLALTGYYPFHAARAEFLRRLGHGDEAADAFRRAAELAPPGRQRDFLRNQARRTPGSPSPGTRKSL